VIEEPESDELGEYLAAGEPAIATSRIALVEVTRATAIANPSPEARAEAERLLASCLLVDVSDGLLRAAARLTSPEVRTLDAVHLASAQRVGPDAVLVYDRRLREAARAAGFSVAHPGAPG
jgi:predicted nucleic acid-binding protein